MIMSVVKSLAPVTLGTVLIAISPASLSLLTLRTSRSLTLTCQSNS